LVAYRAELRVGVHLLQAPILILQLLELGHHRGIHAAELAAPLVERCRADAVLPAEVRNGGAGLGLLEYGDDLAIGDSVTSSWDLLGIRLRENSTYGCY
jgi:hypothetical protein